MAGDSPLIDRADRRFFELEPTYVVVRPEQRRFTQTGLVFAGGVAVAMAAAGDAIGVWFAGRQGFDDSDPRLVQISFRQPFRLAGFHFGINLVILMRRLPLHPFRRLDDRLRDTTLGRAVMTSHNLFDCVRRSHQRSDWVQDDSRVAGAMTPAAVTVPVRRRTWRNCLDSPLVKQFLLFLIMMGTCMLPSVPEQISLLYPDDVEMAGLDWQYRWGTRCFYAGGSLLLVGGAYVASDTHREYEALPDAENGNLELDEGREVRAGCLGLRS